MKTKLFSFFLALATGIVAAMTVNAQTVVELADVANYIDFQALSVSDPAMVNHKVTSTDPYELANGTVLIGYQNSETGAEADNKWNVKDTYNYTLPTPTWEGVDSLKVGTMFRAASGTTIVLGAFKTDAAGKLAVYYQPNGDSERGVSISVYGEEVDGTNLTGSGVKIDGVRPAYAAEINLPAGSYEAGDVVIKLIVNTSNIFGVGIKQYEEDTDPVPTTPIVYPTYVPQIWPILMDETTFEANQYAVVSDFRTNDIDQFLYIWENTYYGLGATGKNFYGNSEGYLSLSVENLGWAGGGYCLTGNESGRGWQDAEKLRQAMVANPDEYFLHLAIKSTDNYSHCFYFFNNENTKFVLGSNSVYDGAVYGDFTRDGAWHEFYIPMSQFASGFADYPLQENTNVFILLSEGVQGAQLNLDAVYFCNRYAKEHNVPQAYDPDDDPSVNPGPYAIRVDDNSLDDWNNLPASYVAQAYCPADAVYPALKSVKVFADQTYINILVEPNMDDIVDLEWVPFHVFINTDNSDATGGYGDEFIDANTDILCESALFCDRQPYNYNPAVFKWWGEVGGNGWDWVDWSVEHDASDFWGAIIGEGQLPLGKSQFVDGKFEIQLLRELLGTVAPMNNEMFSIGFDIQQNWSSVGVLPCNPSTDDNPSGYAAKLKVKVHPSTPGETPIVEKDVVINGIRYILDNANNTAHVTYKNDEPYSGAINIPAQITYNDVTYDVISIGESAFAYCYDLTAITIPNGVTVIGDGAFYACTGLTSIVFPNSVKYFGYQVIGECNNLISLSAPAELLNNYNSLERLENLVVTGGELSHYALGYISYYTIKSLDLSATTNTELPDWILSGCYNLRQLVLPANLNRISYMAISDCIRLESIVIPGSVTEIDARAFENCRSLQSVTFAGTALKSLGDWAFYNCHELSTIDLPEGVEYIGKAAFYGCAYLNEIVVPASVQAMGDNAFALCSRLQKITSNAVVPPTIAEKTFFEVSTEIPVYVPEVSVAAYKADQFWGRLNIVGAETAVQNTTVDANAIRKQVINGQLLILRDGKTYTVQGQEIK